MALNVQTEEGRNWLIDQLKKGIVEVTFKKVQSTETRTMNCTLQESALPVYERKTERDKKPNLEVLAVWDTDKKEWRSFRMDHIIKITYKG